MEHLGRYAQGDTLFLSVWCRDSSGTPAEPADSPCAVVCSDTATVASFRMPICDRYAVTGYFSYPLQLDTRFPAGTYRVVYDYKISSTAYAEAASFEVGAGGHADGPALACYYFARPTSDFIIMQCDSGRVIRRRNPRL